MAYGYRRKRHYSTAQRILIHLSSVSGPFQSEALPLLTQEGIGAATRSGRTTATKWLARLEQRGLVAGGRDHVPGHRMRKTVYRLTEAGWTEARSVRSKLHSDLVEVSVPDVGPVTMRVSEIPDLFPDLVDLPTTVSLVSQGRLDLRPLARARRSGPGGLLWGETLPRAERIFGRAAEFRALDAWAASRSHILIVSGLAGIGKSTLVASWIQRRPRTWHVFWHDLARWTDPASFVQEMGTFLAHLGRRSLASQRAEGRPLDLEVAVRVLQHELASLEVFLVLDDFQKTTPAMQRFLADSLFPIAKASRTRMVLLSRTLPRNLVRTEGRKAGLVTTLRVGGLDPEASVMMLRAKGLAADDVTASRVAASTRGHPLLLSLAALGGVALSAKVRKFMEEEILRSLTDGEELALAAASLFRRAAPVGALLEIPGVSEGNLIGLRAKDLLEPTVGGDVIVPDAVREFVRDVVQEDRKRELHGHIARHFLSKGKPGDVLEALYHTFEAGKARDAAEVLARNGTALVDSVSAPEVARLLDAVNPADLDARAAAIVAEVHGDALWVCGHVLPALMQYRTGIRQTANAGPGELSPRLLRKIASVERHRNQYALALGHLVEAQARLTLRPDSAESAEVLREMALVEQAQGDLASATAHVGQAIDFATEASDAASLARGLLALSFMEGQRGNAERRLQLAQEGLRVASRAANLTEAARATIIVGAANHELKRHEEALREYEKGAQLASLVGNLRLSAYATMNRSALLMDLERYDDAASPLVEAKQLFRLLGERDTTALLEVHEGILQWGLGRRSKAKRAWEHGFRSMRECAAPYDLAGALKSVGILCMEHGEREYGGTLLREAAAIARKLDNPSMLAEIEAHLDVRHPEGADPTHGGTSVPG